MISNPPFDGVYGGAEIFAKNVAIGLSKRGHEVHLLCEKQNNTLPDREEINSVYIHRYAYFYLPKLTWLLTNPRSMFKTGKKIVEEYGIDIIYSIELYQTGWVGAKLSTKFNLPFVLALQNTHDTYLDVISSIPFPIRRIIEERIKWSLNSANKLHTVGRAVKKSYIDYFKLQPQKFHVISNGVDTEKFKPSKEKSKYQEYSKENFPVLVYPARFNQNQKRHDIVVEAIRILKDEYNYDPFAYLVGNGDPSYVIRDIKSKGIKDNFFVGKVPHEDMPSLYNESDLCIFPTNYEGCSLALLEIISSGLPVIGTDIPEVREVVDENAGTLVENDPRLFADEVSRLCKDERVLEQKSRNARNKALEFTWERVTDRIEKMLLNKNISNIG